MSYNPEQALWQAVMLQATEDALQGCSGVSRANRAGADRAARHWFQHPSLDFTDVCNLAGLDPEAVRSRMLQRLTTASDPGEIRKQITPMLLTHDGQSLTLTQWSERTGISVNSIYGRLKKGWSVERTLTTPAGPTGRRKAKDRKADAQAPGVCSNFSNGLGTGAGKAAQDGPKIDFTKEPAQ